MNDVNWLKILTYFNNMHFNDYYIPEAECVSITIFFIYFIYYRIGKDQKISSTESRELCTTVAFFAFILLNILCLFIFPNVMT